jgi:hypothetical protein
MKCVLFSNISAFQKLETDTLMVPESQKLGIGPHATVAPESSTKILSQFENHLRCVMTAND